MNSTLEEWEPPQWMHDFVAFRKAIFMRTVEPIICTLLGPTEAVEDRIKLAVDGDHRRLGFLPSYVSDVNHLARETSMSFATLMVLFLILNGVFLIFLSCFHHNQKTSPLFTSPRRQRLPNLVPPPLPVDGVSRIPPFDSIHDVSNCFFSSSVG